MGKPWRWTLSLRMMVLVMMMMVVVLRIGEVSARRFGESAKKVGKDVALELTPKGFNSSLWAAPATFAIVEFYAHWCPACQKFKPHYERVAQLFNGHDAVYPGVLLMARVDCAEEINRNLCQRFLVQRYPTMLWGKPAKFAWGSRLQQKDEVFEQIDSNMNAKSLLDWINAHLKTSYSLDEVVQKKQSPQVGSRQLGGPIHDIEEATAEAYDIILDNKLVSSNHRAPFVQFVQLLAAHHPSRRCRAGSAQILFNLADVWPTSHILDIDEPVTEGGSQTRTGAADIGALRQMHICGEDLPSKTYS